MFSSFHHQKKAESLVEEARTLVNGADKAYEEAKNRLIRTIEKIDATRKRLIEGALRTFEKRFEEIRNEPPIELPPIAERPIAEQLHRLAHESKAKTVRFENVQRGKGGARFAALIAALLTLAALLGAGAVFTGVPLEPKTFLEMPRLMHIFEWIGGGFYSPAFANPFVGMGVTLAAMWLVWTIVKSLFMAKAARRNLETAERIHEAARQYGDSMEEISENLLRVSGELDRLEKVYETCEVYLDEYNAALRRILFVEGNDYQSYRPESQKTVGRAAACSEALHTLFNIAIVTSEGTPASQLDHAILHGEKVVVALIEERELPDYDEAELQKKADPIILPHHAEDASDSKREFSNDAAESDEIGETTEEEAAVEEREEEETAETSEAVEEPEKESLAIELPAEGEKKA